MYMCIYDDELTFGNLSVVSCEPCSLPHETTIFGQESWNFSAEELISHWVSAASVALALIHDIPRPARQAVIVRPSCSRCRELGLFGVKRVSVRVCFASHRFLRRDDVDGVDSVGTVINIAVEAEAEEMLVKVGIHPRVNLGTVLARLIRGLDVGVENAGKFYFRLDCAILLQKSQYGESSHHLSRSYIYTAVLCCVKFLSRT